MIEILGFLVSGVVFGAVAGVSPGPLLALVISETVRHSKKEGILVAAAPLVTDAPIVALSLLVLAKLSSSDVILAVISLAGAGFIGYLAWESLKVKGMEVDLQQVKAHSLRKGLLTNVLSPHPYIFWGTIGAPTVLAAWRTSRAAAVLWIAGFYLLLVGSKVAIALMVDKSKGFLKSAGYVWVIRILGVALLIFAVVFVRQGIMLLMGE
ncbi:MAG: LysE family transporter [Planctomycetes bacterium]|nr:LysE family transporter [Planctomycetota bacterium]